MRAKLVRQDRKQESVDFIPGGERLGGYGKKVGDNRFEP